METRTKHTYRTNLYEFVRDIAVVCPTCARRAVVRTGNFEQMKYDIEGVRVVCAVCGFCKNFEKTSRRSPHLVFGVPLDPFFKLPVWLQTACCGDLLWAYNLEHLEFLRQHVEAKLHERTGFKFQVRSIGARLPRWMTSAKNRPEVLKSIENLGTGSLHFLASNAVDDPPRFTEALREGILIQAKLIRKTIRNARGGFDFYPDQFSWEVERVLRSVERFEKSGVDYRPAIDEPSDFDKPDFRCRAVLDRWLQAN